MPAGLLAASSVRPSKYSLTNKISCSLSWNVPVQKKSISEQKFHETFFVEHRSPKWNFMSLFRWAPLADLITTFRSFLKCASTCTCGPLHLPRNRSLLRDRAFEWNRSLGDPWIFKGRLSRYLLFQTSELLTCSFHGSLLVECVFTGARECLIASAF